MNPQKTTVAHSVASDGLIDLVDECRRQWASPSDWNLKAHIAEIDRAPTQPLPIYSLARLCRRRGHIALWRRLVDIARAIPHETNAELWCRADVSITLDYWSGWRDREVRVHNAASRYFQSAFVRELQWARCPWDGIEDLHNEGLFVVADGGFGDCIQTLRFIPWLASIARDVVFCVRPEVASLIQCNLGHLIHVTTVDDEPTVPCEYYTWAMSLPVLHGSVPPFTPLIAPRTDADFGALSRPRRIGICWAGSARNPTDRRRSVSLDMFEPLFALSAVEWYSLQVGARMVDALGYPCVKQPATALLTFAETASLISCLDAVVTVDTSVAHLASALGARTFVMLPFVSEFRWGLKDTTPWYPSTRLIRQSTPGDWPSVIRKIVALLDEPQWATSIAG